MVNWCRRHRIKIKICFPVWTRTTPSSEVEKVSTHSLAKSSAKCDCVPLMLCITSLQVICNIVADVTNKLVIFCPGLAIGVKFYQRCLSYTCGRPSQWFPGSFSGLVNEYLKALVCSGGDFCFRCFNSHGKHCAFKRKQKWRKQKHFFCQ